MFCDGWEIPRTEARGRLQSTESQRVGHDGATSLSLFTLRALGWRWVGGRLKRERYMHTHS